MTENIEDAFLGSEPEPWLRRRRRPLRRQPPHSWTVSLSFASAAARLRGLFKGSFRGIEVLKRGVSPRIVSAQVLGSTRRTLVSGPELAGALGLNSTWALLQRAAAARTRQARARPQRPARTGSPTAPTTPAPPPPARPGGVAPAPSTRHRVGGKRRRRHPLRAA